MNLIWLPRGKKIVRCNGLMTLTFALYRPLLIVEIALNIFVAAVMFECSRKSTVASIRNERRKKKEERRTTNEERRKKGVK